MSYRTAFSTCMISDQSFPLCITHCLKPLDKVNSSIMTPSSTPRANVISHGNGTTRRACNLAITESKGETYQSSQYPLIWEKYAFSRNNPILQPLPSLWENALGAVLRFRFHHPQAQTSTHKQANKHIIPESVVILCA